MYRTANVKPFAATLYLPDDVPNEHRGAGQVGGACLRFVRTIFDGTNTDANCELVLGEVITMPGRWSSYPPHHHRQPEIYHYRFTEPRGYGHAELGDTVLKVRQYDTVKIFDGNDHAQCTAPGYGMYYAWVIRHLPGDRYTVPEFTDEPPADLLAIEIDRSPAETDYVEGALTQARRSWPAANTALRLSSSRRARR